MPRFEVAAASTTAELVALAPEWDALWTRSPTATPFQSPAWLVPWWRHFGHGELLAVTVRRGGALVGLLPLYILKEPPVRKLLPLGIGISDYLDGVFDPAWAEDAAAAALAYVAQMAERWDIGELHQLPPGSPLLTAAADRLAEQTAPGEPCSMLSLPGRIEDLPHRLPRRMAANQRYYRRRAEKVGQVRFERADAASLPVLLESLFDLHSTRWRARGEPGVLADEAVRRFHRDAAPALLGQGVLRLDVLRLDERPIAACYGLLAKGRASAYLTGFNPAFAPLSPGTLILAHAVAQAIQSCATSFDFLRGGEAYKRHWGATACPTYRRTLWRRTLTSGSPAHR